MNRPAKIFRILFLGLFFWCLSFSFSAADGMIIPPPLQNIKEANQKAVIFFEEDTETLIISIDFEGDAGEFAWVIPTPAKPEVKKSVSSLFTRLQEITSPKAPMATGNRQQWTADNAKLSAESVTVLEEKQIEYYDIAILEATDKNALYEWLNNNGYQFPENGKDIINEYIQNNWIFTAIKINNKQADNSLVQRQLQKGTAIPLELKFKTNKIVYPLKVSSISGSEGNAPKGEVTFLKGKEGRGVKLDSDRVLASDQVIKGFSIGEGHLKFSLKKPHYQPLDKIISLKKGSQTNNYIEELNISNTNENVFSFQLSNNYFKGGNQNLYYFYSVDLGSDFKPNTWQDFEFTWKMDPVKKAMTINFALDGISRVMTSRTGNIDYTKISKNPFAEQVGDSFLTIGGETILSFNGSTNTSAQSLSHRSLKQNDLLLDQLSISANQEQEAYLNIDFEDNLEFKNQEQKNTLRVFNAQGPRDLVNDSDNKQTGVTLYLFADSQYEVPGFNTEFADWFTKQEIENFATIDGVKSWITPQKEEYFLTKLYRSMEPADMTEDLYPQKIVGQEQKNSSLSPKQKATGLYSLLFLSAVSILAMITFVVIQNKN